MVRVLPETEGQPVETWPETSAPGGGIGSSSWGFEASRAASSPDEAGAPPGEKSSDSSGGGRFWRRLLPRRPGGEGSGVDLRNTWQVVAGSILVPLGVVLILIAWYGAAHTAYVQQQIPYLVSGSFAGLGCIVLGGLFYWAHWLYRLYDQADHHHEEQLQAMQMTLRAIADRLPGGNGWVSPHVAGPEGGPFQGQAQPQPQPQGYPPAPGRPEAGAAHDASSSAGPVSATYVVTSAGTVYHLPSCPIIAHHTEGLRVLGAGAVVEMEPCRICMSGQGV